MLLWDGALGLQLRVTAGLVSPDYRVFTPQPEIDPAFAEYLLKSPTVSRHFKSGARGTNVRRNRIARSDFGSIRVAVPALFEQRKIAAILSSVDDTIERTQAVIDQLEVVRKALLQELLTRGMPGRHIEFKRTDIGLVPAQWEVVRLDTVAEIRTGLAKNSRKASSSRMVELPYLRVANVQDGYLDLSEIKTIAVEEALVGRYALQDGDVLFNEGGDADKLGRGTVWRQQLALCLHQNHVFAARPSASIVPEFLSLYGGSARGKAYFLDSAKQTTNLASINSTQLKALPVPLPPIEEQREIVRAASVIEERVSSEAATLQRMKTMKAALLDALLTGRIRVNVTDQEAA